MKNLAPDIYRQRILIEGCYTIDIDSNTIEKYLNEIAKHLNLRTYGQPIIFSPVDKGKPENQGFDAFIPLIDSGISIYIWSSQKFFSVVLYSCKKFNNQSAVDFSTDYFQAKNGIEWEDF